MQRPEDSAGAGERWTRWRESIIGLGEQSSRKTYFPELQRRLAELKNSEEKLRTVFNSTHDAIFIHRYDGTIDEVNDPMLSLYRVPRERALEFTIADYTSPEARKERLPRLLEELRRTRQDQLFEWRARRPLDGTEFDVEVSLRPSFWGGHEVVVAVVRDISERKQAEVERRRLEAELAQLYRMESIGRLAGGVAHDFNNMLTPILSYAVMLRDDLAIEDERRVDLGEIVRSAERARDLVRQLLAFARRQTFELRPLDLNDAIRSFQRMLRRVLREDISLRLELSEQPATVFADVGQIEQVLMNLAVNAQDAMPQGGTLALATTVLSSGAAALDLPAGPLVRLCVTDSGTGMDPVTIARIFEPFFTTKEQGRGTGLGLASVYGIVQQHGGRIQVSSEPGRGSTFSLFFAWCDQQQSDGAVPDDPVGSQPAGTGTILVAEDQEQVRLLVAKVLGRAGYKVLLAESGEEALRVAEAQETPIDLLVSDVVMPGMNGRELLGCLRERWAGTKALFVSGYAVDVVATGLDLLQKPFTPQALLARVREALVG